MLCLYTLFHQGVEWDEDVERTYNQATGKHNDRENKDKNNKKQTNTKDSMNKRRTETQLRGGRRRSEVETLEEKHDDDRDCEERIRQFSQCPPLPEYPVGKIAPPNPRKKHGAAKPAAAVVCICIAPARHVHRRR